MRCLFCFDLAIYQSLPPLYYPKNMRVRSPKKRKKKKKRACRGRRIGEGRSRVLAEAAKAIK